MTLPSWHNLLSRLFCEVYDLLWQSGMAMDANIYKTPNADLTEDVVRRGSPVKAIALAVMVDVLGSVLVGVGLFVTYLVVQVLQGVEPDAVMELFNRDMDGPLITVLLIVLGSAVSVYAGYLCAKAVNHHEYRYVGVYVLIMVMILSIPGADEGNVVEDLAYAALTFISGYIGAWLHVHNKDEQFKGNVA